MTPLTAGSILVDTTTRLPSPFPVEAFEETGWSRIAGNADIKQFETALTAAGWNFFYTAGAIRATTIGFTPQDRLDDAFRRLLRTAKEQGGNCLQIDSVATGTSWGLPCVRVSGHSRQIQKSNLFVMGDNR